MNETPGMYGSWGELAVRAFIYLFWSFLLVVFVIAIMHTKCPMAPSTG